MEESVSGGAPLASYAYDVFGQRVSKTTASGGGVHYIHDDHGRLIAEHDGITGAPLREYIWLGLTPGAMVDHSGGAPTTYYIHTDQVMNPQKMTDASGAVVWDRVATPFGVEVQTTGALTQPLKFPGQVEDLETSLFQNWNRDYDPSLGRYVQSDPIGLMGGINTYAYVSGNPLSRFDPKGLKDQPWPINSRICNQSSGGSIIAYDPDNKKLECLGPKMCTSPNQDAGDFGFFNGEWKKCGPFPTCSLRDNLVRSGTHGRFFSRLKSPRDDFLQDVEIPEDIMSECGCAR